MNVKINFLWIVHGKIYFLWTVNDKINFLWIVNSKINFLWIVNSNFNFMWIVNGKLISCELWMAKLFSVNMWSIPPCHPALGIWNTPRLKEVSFTKLNVYSKVRQYSNNASQSVYHLLNCHVSQTYPITIQVIFHWVKFMILYMYMVWSTCIWTELSSWYSTCIWSGLV